LSLTQKGNYSRGKILLFKRSDDLKFYPGYWHCIAGFIDFLERYFP